jgi:ATP-dependent DNA helicase RecG
VQLNQFSTVFHRRLTFDRFFLVMLTLAYRKSIREGGVGPQIRVPPGLMDTLKTSFPFELTGHQRRAIRDLIHDFSSGKPMNRLLMGDVGSGKTVIAAVAAHICARSGKQTALMVPTQVLANQHMETFSGLSPKLGFHPLLLTSGLPAAVRRKIHDTIRQGRANLIIGTQSLIQESLSFHDLGLVTIDEQHRFGVRERALMCGKGENPHLLVMTATPIPRTLAIGVYGDMDISTIEEYPRGRVPVRTLLVPEQEKRLVFEILLQKLSAGRQAFVVCPVIEESEELDLKNAVEMAEKLDKILKPRYRTGLIHGRLEPVERERVIAAFKKGLIHLLVATSVVEVGVHVPRATVMVIENPERFGLSQLHQIRGRIGRGSDQGICFLMIKEGLSESAASRLKTLVDCNDGFTIAQKDLELRGHGQFLGYRQSGVGELDFTEMLKEADLLLEAKEEARRLILNDPHLFLPENRYLRGMLESLLREPLDL